MPSAAEPSVIVRRQGRIGRLTLNRPDSLNALDLEMIRRIASALDDWQDDPSVHAVALDAAGRAFCAGGDIRAIRSQMLAGNHAGAEQFFLEEYALNLEIARYPKPYVSLIDGICMGGGIGLSVHGGIRVASEAATFAMPETAIGFFPDIGATYILPRLRGHYGMYLALTGARVGGADAAWLGLATHFVPRETIGGLAYAMAEDGVSALTGAVAPLPAPTVDEAGIAAFGADSVAGIVAGLERLGTDWSRETLAALRRVSPSAVHWTFEIVRRGARQTLEQCFATELALTRRAGTHPDFAEGVRAMVIDKDRSPQWSPASLEQVDVSALAAWFQ